MKITNKILLLESDLVAAEDIKSSLKNFGYCISGHITKTKELISAILKDKPDLILMEVTPGEELHDAEMAQLICDNYQLSVIFLATFESKTIIEKSKRSNLIPFIFKPVETKELVSIVELVLFRHSMERKLFESEKKFNDLSNSILQTIIECDLEGKIVYLNLHGLKTFGLTEEDLAKDLSLSTYIQNNTSGSMLDVIRKSSFIDMSGLNREFKLVNALGKIYFVEEWLTPVFSNFKPTGYRGILIDVTHKKLKQSLCCTFSCLNNLYDRADVNIKEISGFVISELKELFSDLDTICFEERADEHNTQIYPDGTGGLDIHSNKYIQFVADSGKPLFVREKEHGKFDKQLDIPKTTPAAAACWLGFPLISKTISYGTFVLSSKTNPNAISIKDYENLCDFFDNVKLFLEKINCLKELKRSENLFKSLVNTINEGLIKIDLNSDITFVNNRLHAMSGYEQEDVLGKRSIDFLEPKGVKILTKALECRKNGVSSQYEISIKVKSGEYKEFYINGAPYRDENGVIIGALGTLTDITAKKEQLALFTATETLLREITSAIDVAFWIYSLETKSIKYLSPAFKAMFEVELEEIYKMNSLRNFIHPEDVKHVVERNATNLSAGECEIKYRIITPDGRVKWIQDKSILVKDSNGKVIKVIGYAQEITRLKLTEEKLLKSETEKENIIKSIPDSFIVIGKQHEILNSYFKNSEKQFLHSKANRIQGKRISEVFDKKIAGLIIDNAGLSYNSLKTIVFELDVTYNDSISWYEIRMSCMDGEKILMIIRNITLNKNNIDSIQKLFNITEQTRELIMITDSAGKIEYVNPMFTTVTGYQPNEILGRTPSVLKSKKHNVSFYKNLWSTLKAGEIFKGDFYNNKKSGELFIEEKIITPYVDINGEITNFISTGRVVTQERQNTLKTDRYKHLERTLALKQQKNRTLSLIHGHEKEARKFAKEIHEGLNQTLAVAMMNLESISTNELINVEQKGRIEFVNKMVSEIMQELRGISTNLSPVSLFEFGLHSVIQQMANRLNLKIKDVEISFKSNIAGLRFEEDIEINFYRIIQEALQNALKHSKAKKITLALSFNYNKLVFLIKDNGVGINKREFEVKKKKCFGICNLEERAAILGAQLEVTTNKNKGFEINMAVKTKIINL